jgi:iron complex outermembrane receptor protein
MNSSLHLKSAALLSLLATSAPAQAIPALPPGIPVTVVDTDAMGDSGVSADTLDLLRKVVPDLSGVGQENAQSASGSTLGGAEASLMGLPALVLVDGRRVANDPVAGVGGPQFVDLNLIPPAAIERVEVVQDGASALYGADAVGGVINLVLRRDFRGWEAGVHYGFSTAAGHYQERSGYVVGGAADGTTSVTVALDYARHGALFLSSRAFSNPQYGTYTAPGTLENFDYATGADAFYVLAPGVGAPPGGSAYTLPQLVAMGTYVPETRDQAFHRLNLATGETLAGALRRRSAVVTGEQKILGDRLVAFGDAVASFTRTWSQVNAQPLVPYVSDPYTDGVVSGESPPPAGVLFVPSTAPTNPFSTAYLNQAGDGISGEGVYPRDRYTDHPRLSRDDATLVRMEAGLRGDLTDSLHWEAAAVLNRGMLDYSDPGVLDTAALLAAWADGKLNPFALSNPASAFVGVAGTASVGMVSTLDQFDLRIGGTALDLPAGPLSFSAGGSLVHESLSASPDASSLPDATGSTEGWLDATPFRFFGAGRDVSSAYGTLSVPVAAACQGIPGIHVAAVDAAVRDDSYSGGVGSIASPRFGITWKPLSDELMLRASAGRAFNAPSLFSLHGPVQAGTTDYITYTTAGGGTETSSFNEASGSNPGLKATVADRWTAGLLLTPSKAPGLSLSVDYAEIMERHVIGIVPAAVIIQDVEARGLSSPYASDVHLDSPDGASPVSPGEIGSRAPQSVYVVDTLSNGGSRRIESTTASLGYLWKAADGTLGLTSVWTWYESYRLQPFPTGMYYGYAGEASQAEGTIPRWRGYTTLAWRRRGAEAVAGITCVSRVTDVGMGGVNASGFEGVGSFASLDIGLSGTFGGLKAKLGVNNFANRVPPAAAGAFPDTRADVGAYGGAVGRMWYAEASYRF